MAEFPVDLIFALLLAAAAGWFAHQVFRHRAAVPKVRTEPFNRDYFHGLNLLLDDQPDAALHVLQGLAAAEPNTIEAQLALGHLYRRRGEVNQAIQVHEALTRRDDLPVALRDLARWSLGKDFMRAGLLDRAEECFKYLLSEEQFKVPALRQLLRIHEQQRDWSDAMHVYEQLAALASPEHPTALAHYDCELADAATQEGAFALADEWIQKAFAVQRNFPRGALSSAALALKQGNARDAALSCKRLMELHPHLLTQTLPTYLQALRALGSTIEHAEPEWSLHTTDPKRRAALGYAALVAGVVDEPYLLRCLGDLLRQDANLGELVQAIAGDITQFSDGQLKALAAALSKTFRRTQRFRCVSCGVTTGTHFWQCPGCHSWDTLTPVTRLELTPEYQRA